MLSPFEVVPDDVGYQAGNTTSGASCTSPCTGVIGEFVRFVGLDEAEFELPESGDPIPTDYGAVVVGLDE